MKGVKNPRDQAGKNIKIWQALSLTVAVCLIGMTAYQLIKRAVLPEITLLESNILTVLFTSLIAAVVAYFYLRKYYRLYQQTLEEIAKQKRVEEALRHRDAILEGINCSIEHFLTTTDRQVSINNLLACLGRVAHVSRAYIFENHVDAHGPLLTSQRYEWVAPDIDSQRDNPDRCDFPLEPGALGRWASEMKNHKAISGHVRELPEGEREILASQAIKSILAVPIFIGSEWWGFIAYDECLEEREWLSSELEALRSAAAILAAVIQHHRMQERTNLLKSIVESSNEAIGVCDPQGRLVYVNPAFESLSRHSFNESLGLDIRDYFAPESVECIDRIILPQLMESKGWDGELHALDARGNFFPLWVRVDSVHDDQGNMLFAFGIAHDISEKKQMEQELAEYRVHLENLVEDRTHELALTNEQLKREIDERMKAEGELRNGQEQMKALSSRLAEIEESERRRLALDLHDRVGQNLAGLGVNLNLLKGLLASDSARRAEALIKDSSELVKETVKCIRDVMADLRPPVLDDYGLAAALHWYGEEFSKRSGIAIRVNVEESEARLPQSVETALFRIAQEALTNVVRHARATQVRVALETIADGFQFTIADNGEGFDMETAGQPGKQGGWGLISMRERADGIGGKFYVESSPGKGTRIIIKFTG